MYGAQAERRASNNEAGFENDVEMYGAQAANSYYIPEDRFENDVEMYGAQADTKLSSEAG